MWFITLLVLALAAFFIIKAVKAHSARQSAEQERLREGSGLAGSLAQDHHSTSAAENTADATVSTPVSAAAAGLGAATTATAAVASTAANAAESGAGTSAILGVNTGDNLQDVQEMIKILNLAEPDAGRLAISREQFSALRAGQSEQAPSNDALADVADKLRRMLA